MRVPAVMALEKVVDREPSANWTFATMTAFAFQVFCLTTVWGALSNAALPAF